MSRKPECALMPQLLGEPGRCDRASCGMPLPERRKRWCSDDCASIYHREVLQNHDWAAAREAALERDGRVCVKCGGNGVAPAEEVAAAWRSYEVKVAFAVDPHSRAMLIDEARGAVRELDRQYQLEVNHIVPRRGRGYGSGCHHHLDNLETLCKPCHVAVTNEQRRGAA